jgi:hypothetical protein
MDEKQILSTINTDLAITPARRVIYLEGKTDPPIFFGLLGLPQPRPGDPFLHQRTLVKGFSATDGSGNTTVRAYVDIAETNGFGGRVFGIVDGDGEAFSSLAARFDPPHIGPLFTWKAYSIESLLAQLPWPTTASWGPEPNWQEELAVYAPYIAINAIRRILVGRLDTLRLSKFWNPINGKPLETIVDVQAALEADKGLLASLDAATEFGEEVTRYLTALATSIEEGMALLNGKWLLRHFMVDRLRHDPDYWSQVWVQHAESVGGLAEVRILWQRITGTLP